MEFIEKFKSVLPSDVVFDELYDLAPADLWKTDPRKAGVIALERADCFDSNAYLREYKDVRESEIGAIEHWVKHGINEGRTFYNLKKLTEEYRYKHNKKIVICVGYHKPSFLLKGDCFIPIWGGKACSNVISKDGNGLSYSEKLWMKKNCIGDDTGKNISIWNRNYNESTVLFWMWKNIEKLGNPEFIGFLQYRRHWILNELYKPNAKLTNSNLLIEEYFSEDHQEKIGLTQENLENLVNKYDGIFCIKEIEQTVYEYKANHHSQKIEYWDLACELIKKRWKKYSTFLDEYNNGNIYVWSNTFIMRTENFFEYCNFLFDIINKIHTYALKTYKNLTPEQMRIPGYVSETMLGIYYSYLKYKNLSLKSYRLLYIRNPFKTNENFYESCNIGKVNKGDILIAFITDSKYLKYASVSIRSIIKYSDQSRVYKIVILEDGTIEDDVKNVLIKSLPSNITLNFFDCSYYFNKYDFNSFYHKRLNNMTYLKIFIPLIFKDYNKVLFIDSDTLILGDISKIYDIEIKNDKYICAVQDKIMVKCHNKFWKSKREYILREKKLKNIENYFNSGLILFDVKKFLKDNNIYDKLLFEAKFNHPERCTHDQDALNFSLENKVKYINDEYNFQTSVLSEQYKSCLPVDIDSKYKKLENENKILVVHYDGSKQKPWLYIKNRTSLIEKWWKIAKDTQFYEEIICDTITNTNSIGAPIFFTVDPLRSSVEALSGGLVTVLYDNYGLPNYMRVIPRYNIEDLYPELGIKGVHPAFIINDEIKNEIFISLFLNSKIENSVCSLPKKRPASGTSFEEAVEYCRKKGNGWHLLTNIEYSLIQALCYSNNFTPHGNSEYGKSSICSFERALLDNFPKENKSYGKSLTGTGPQTWRHDGTFFGISDLVGNVEEFVSGLIFLNNKILYIKNNDSSYFNKNLDFNNQIWSQLKLFEENVNDVDSISIIRDYKFNKVKNSKISKFCCDFKNKKIHISTDAILYGVFNCNNFFKNIIFNDTNNLEVYIARRGGTFNMNNHSNLYTLNFKFNINIKNSFCGFRSSFNF